MSDRNLFKMSARIIPVAPEPPSHPMPAAAPAAPAANPSLLTMLVGGSGMAFWAITRLGG
jgi:hypothetical protein